MKTLFAYAMILGMTCITFRPASGDYSRFIAAGNGTVKDIEKHLTWQQRPTAKRMDWKGATAYAKGLRLAGKSDWRLPTYDEISDFADGRDPGVPPFKWFGKFGFTILPKRYWTSTDLEMDPVHEAYSFDMAAGTIGNRNKKELYQAICVRSGE